MHRSNRHGLFLFSVLLILSSRCFGQEADTTSADRFRVSVAYTGDFLGNMAGGRDTGFRYTDNIDVNLQINFGTLPLGLRETTFYVYGLGNEGGSISSLTGDYQGVSNIDGDTSWRIFEAWLQKKFLLAKSSVLMGLYDINAEFNVLNSSLLFLNSSHGLDPTLGISGVLGPSSFQYTSLGVRFKINPVGGWVFEAAALDGIPSNPSNPQGTKIFWRKRDGLLLIGELAFYSVGGRTKLQFRNRTARLQHFLGRGASGNSTFKVAFGAWTYTKKRMGWDPANSRQYDHGVYGISEYKIYSEPRDQYQGMAAFMRAGLANEQINRLGGYLGGGLVYTGLLPDRDNDQAGIAVAYAVNSSGYRKIHRYPGGLHPTWDETNIEGTYLATLTNSMGLQCDVQYIFHPGMDPTLGNGLAAGMRLLLSF